MQTSQTKKGNPQRKSRMSLRSERAKADRERREEAGLPIGNPHLPECPHCAAAETPVIQGVTRTHVRMRIVECCKGTVTRAHMRSSYYPKRKKRQA